MKQELFKDHADKMAASIPQMSANKDAEIDSGPRMYIFVNSDLNMGKGKIAAQVGHVVEMLTHDILRGHYEKRGSPEIYKNYMLWKSSGARKIVLKADSKNMEELSNIPSAHKVFDAGLTQIPSGSLTVVGFFPCNMVDEFKEYKLL